MESYDNYIMDQVLDAHWGVLYDEDVIYHIITIFTFQFFIIIKVNYKFQINGAVNGSSISHYKHSCE